MSQGGAARRRGFQDEGDPREGESKDMMGTTETARKEERVRVPRAKCGRCGIVGQCHHELVPTMREDNAGVKSQFTCVDEAACDERRFGGPETTCDRCQGSGNVAVGRESGTCYRCKGKGKQTKEDRRRNRWYDEKFRSTAEPTMGR